MPKNDFLPVSKSRVFKKKDFDFSLDWELTSYDTRENFLAYIGEENISSSNEHYVVSMWLLHQMDYEQNMK